MKAVAIIYLLLLWVMSIQLGFKGTIKVVPLFTLFGLGMALAIGRLS